jgi:hypothetical protein
MTTKAVPGQATALDRLRHPTTAVISLVFCQDRDIRKFCNPVALVQRFAICARDVTLIPERIGLN